MMNNMINYMLPPCENLGAWTFSNERYLCSYDAKSRNSAKTMLFADENGKLAATLFPSICPIDVDLMPDFTNITIIDNNGSNKAVIVEFADGTKQKAVLDSGDTFSLEQGISICVTKKLFDMLAPGNGSSLYNKIVTRGLNTYKKIQADKQRAAEKAEREKEKYNKLVNKKRKKNEKREAARREAEIELRKEAYLRAMREYNSAPCDEVAKD